jgi:hypothetical protein
MISRNIISSSLICFSALSAFAWGQKGHDTTVFIAENHLTPITKAIVEELLDGKSMVYYANWLDNASHTPEYAYSKTWHYKNIDHGIDYDKAPLLESGDIVRAINEQVKVLQNENAPREERQLALKMVIHLLGDIHQPMHIGHASDLGGNRWNVKYFGRDNNLHSVWDSSLPESAHKWSYTEWQQQIDRVSEAEENEILKDGNPYKWGEETYNICKQVYANTPEGSKISYDYIAEWTPVIEQQFLKGGLRLADLLNSIYDPFYTPQNTIVNKK